MMKKFTLVSLILTCLAISATANPFNDTTISVKVKGITCAGDLRSLSSNVKDIPGVKDCIPGKLGPTSVFKISYNTALTGRKQIFDALENTAGCEDPKDRPYKVKN